MTRARWLVAAVVLSSAPVGAQERVEVTSTTSVNWHGDNDDDSLANDDYGEGFERLNVTTVAGNWLAGLRLDAATYVSPPIEAPDSTGFENRYQSRFSVEKIYGGYSTRSVDVRVGDSYVSFGRGMALSMRKIDELGDDTTVRGANVSWHEGALSWALVGGISNINNVDEASGRAVADPQDIIAGGRIQGRVDGDHPYALGAHAVVVAYRDPTGFADPADEAASYADRWISFGPTFDAPRFTERWGLYAEGLAQHRGEETGFGLYGAATYHRDRVTWLFEGKAYGDLELVRPAIDAEEFSSVHYAVLPTLERIEQLLDHPPRDTIGGRARVDWRRSDSMLLFANYAVARDYTGYLITAGADMTPVTVPATVQDPYVGGELRWDRARASAAVTAGWRFVVADMTADRVRGDQHLEIDFSRGLEGGASVAAHALLLRRHTYHPPFINQQHQEGTLQVTVRWGPRLSLAGVFDYTTEPLQPKRDYLSVVIESRPSPSWLVRAQLGGTRGGLRCVAGVCREFAPFEGAKLVVTTRY